MTDDIRKYAQYMADSIDASIVLQYTRNMTREDALAATPQYLAEHGWDGRKYPVDFFRMDTVHTYTPDIMVSIQQHEAQEQARRFAKNAEQILTDVTQDTSTPEALVDAVRGVGLAVLAVHAQLVANKIVEPLEVKQV